MQEQLPSMLEAERNLVTPAYRDTLNPSPPPQTPKKKSNPLPYEVHIQTDGTSNPDTPPFMPMIARQFPTITQPQTPYPTLKAFPKKSSSI
jgi:hypothetical protein